MHDELDDLDLENPGAREAARLLIGEGACLFCGCERPHLRLFEAWRRQEPSLTDTRALDEAPGLDFMLDACCPELAAEAVESISQMARSRDKSERQTAKMLMESMGIPSVGDIASVAVDDCGGTVLAPALEVCAITQAQAKAFVNRHHAHHGAPAGWKYGFGVRSGGALVAVTMVGRPVARMLDDGTVLEVNRVAVRRDCAPGLVSNACSMLYAAAAKKAAELGYQSIITYTLQSEGASSLRASGWVDEGRAGGGSWSSKSRPRVDKAPTGAKTRWRKPLRPSRSAHPIAAKPPARPLPSVDLLGCLSANKTQPSWSHHFL